MKFTLPLLLLLSAHAHALTATAAFDKILGEGRHGGTSETGATCSVYVEKGPHQTSVQLENDLVPNFSVLAWAKYRWNLQTRSFAPTHANLIQDGNGYRETLNFRTVGLTSGKLRTYFVKHVISLGVENSFTFTCDLKPKK